MKKEKLEMIADLIIKYTKEGIHENSMMIYMQDFGFFVVMPNEYLQTSITEKEYDELWNNVKRRLEEG